MTPDTSADELRAAATAAVRRFKSGWIELAGILIRIRREEAFRLWGYTKFERYVVKELFIKPKDAEKLIASFAFLERHEPELIGQPPGETTPLPFEVIDVLVKADAQGHLDDESYSEVRWTVLNGIGTPQQRVEQLREHLTPPAKNECPVPMMRRARRTDAGLRHHAESAWLLQEELRLDRRVPADVAELASTLAEALERLLKARSAA
jgi:hypothetical protein